MNSGKGDEIPRSLSSKEIDKDFHNPNQGNRQGFTKSKQGNRQGFPKSKQGNHEDFRVQRKSTEISARSNRNVAEHFRGMSQRVRDGGRHHFPRFLELSRRQGQSVGNRFRFFGQPA